MRLKDGDIIYVPREAPKYPAPPVCKHDRMDHIYEYPNWNNVM